MEVFMNCFKHTDEPAVANCPDCGKGLCKECAGLYEMPICSECNLKRVQQDKANAKKDIVRFYLPSILMFVAGFAIMIFFEIDDGNTFGASLGTGIFMGYLFAGCIWGWRAIKFIRSPYSPLKIALKGTLSIGYGLIALPIGIFMLIKNSASAKAKEQNIINNLNS
jgi:hypothetical protein